MIPPVTADNVIDAEEDTEGPRVIAAGPVEEKDETLEIIENGVHVDERRTPPVSTKIITAKSEYT